MCQLVNYTSLLKHAVPEDFILLRGYLYGVSTLQSPKWLMIFIFRICYEEARLFVIHQTGYSEWPLIRYLGVKGTAMNNKSKLLLSSKWTNKNSKRQEWGKLFWKKWKWKIELNWSDSFQYKRLITMPWRSFPKISQTWFILQTYFFTATIPKIMFCKFKQHERQRLSLGNIKQPDENYKNLAMYPNNWYMLYHYLIF